MTKGECFGKPETDRITKDEFNKWVMRFPPRPSPTSSIPKGLVEMLLAEGILGKRSVESKNYSHLVNLIGMFYLETDDPTYEGQGRFKVEDTGIREISPGNAGGGHWKSKYRYFCIRDHDGNPQVVNFAVIRSLIEQTVLIVAVDRNGQSHNSLQLNLDNNKFVKCAGDTMQILHDGTLTRGKQGRSKRADVLHFIGDRLPQLVRANRIELGSFPLKRLVTWKDAEEFVYNCIEYALVRDEFRRETN
ncbi:MAG: hypothetical protein WB554_01900 [Desulfomonilaceae bacterium]